MGLPTFRVAVILCIFPAFTVWAADKPTDNPVASVTWNEKAAAQYLDQRASWWESWPAAKRDHETVCISCHTMVPYALARPHLRASLAESHVPDAEVSMLGYLKKRVSQWPEMDPYYLDSRSGPGKSRESRSTEAVLNALVLASNGMGQSDLDPLTRIAFSSAWALQLKTGDNAGSWDWQVFHLAPWESSESQYQGATFMALALGWTPPSYRQDSAIQENLVLLKSYLKREYASQPLLNRIVLLWASGRLDDLLSSDEKEQLVAIITKQQQPDGGWSLSSLGSWSRSDHTDQENQSDGYATALVTLAMNSANNPKARTTWQAGRSWLENHQNKEDGSWQATSLNKKRDPKTDVGRFMTDAATGYAVMALETTR